MYNLFLPFYTLSLLTSLALFQDHQRPSLFQNSQPTQVKTVLAKPVVLDCNCSITQSGSTYPVSALLGNVNAPAFYSYNTPLISSANTGLEMADALVLFLYEDINTGIVSLFLIADVGNSGSGGSMEFEANCLPSGAYVSVQDDVGEFFGVPPLITGNWSWGDCCTDGGVIEDIGCNNTVNLDLLVSSGLNSIVWLTGDIANPTQISLGLTGEAITINCGGGVCCPVGFDTGASVTNATCADSENGAISVYPQDGTAPYTYTWSNGASEATITGLAPGWYWVTITDSQGCTDDLAMIIDVSPGDPLAQEANVAVCSGANEGLFDLTVLEDVINIGSGFDVLWFENVDLTGPITDPSQYLSPSATIYAVVDNGSCLSEPVPVLLSVLAIPIGMTATLNKCEENNEMATFDLTSLDQDISGGVGNVNWYLNPGLTNPVPDSEEFFTSSTTVYAVIDDGVCTSEPIEVELIVDLQPIGNPTSMELCGNANDEAAFDLTLLELTVSDGNGFVTWYPDLSLLDEIAVPSTYVTTTTIVYAIVFDGVCDSDPVPVDLIVNPTPNAIPISVVACDDGSGMAVFNLWDYASQVSGGSGAVEWYLDEFSSQPVPDPIAFETGTTIIFAIVDNGICVSAPVQVQLNVLQSPLGNPTNLVICSDTSGQETFNLTLVDVEVSGGVGVVQWFEDAQGLIQISVPSAYVSMGGVVYAQIVLGTCLSELIPITLSIINSVTAIPAQIHACDDGSGIVAFNLTEIDSLVSGGTGQVNWYLDAGGTMPIPSPDAFLSGDSFVYANVSAGTCISSIVQVDLSVSTQVDANPLNLGYCLLLGDTLEIDLTLYDTAISGGPFQVNWFVDSLGTIPIMNTASFTAAADTTLYVYVSDGLCVSSIEPIDFAIQTLPVASPFGIDRCGDVNGLVTVDLTTVESAVSNNIGTVYWWADPAFTIPLSNIDSLVTGDTVVYANVINGSCFSGVVPITVTVVDSLQATPLAIEVCIVDAVTATIDLTQYDLSISNGGGPVFWFEDDLQTISVFNPQAYVTSGDTLFAIVIADGCISNLAEIPVVVEVSHTPVPSCLFTSIDSIAISWPPVVQDYELSYSINGQLVGSPYITSSAIFNAGGLGQSDTLTLSVTALYNGICATPLTNTVTCITEICPAVQLQFLGLQSEYCRDVPFILIQPEPTGGILTGQGLVGDTLFPAMIAGTSSTLFYTWEDQNSGCQYVLSEVLNFTDPPNAPIVDCGPLSLTEVSFEWSGNTGEFEYVYQINQGVFTGTVTTSDTELVIQNLAEGDEVTLYLWVPGQGSCSNSDTVVVTCFTKECPLVTIRLEGPVRYCADDDPVQLELYTLGLTVIDTIIWTGTGIIDPSGIFDPSLALEGANELIVSVSSDGCVYDVPVTILILALPIASFQLSGISCVDSILQVEFTGYTFLGNATFYWELDGAQVTQDNRPFDMSIQWDTPGNYLLSLYIERLGCISDTFLMPVQIDAPLEVPVITCLEENYYSLIVEWEPVPGATSYNVLSSSGNGTLSGTTYTIPNLTDDTPVTVEVTAVGPSACGPTSATIECRTLDYIAPQIYIPNVFSPNGDGINDIFYIQTNDRISEVVSFRIFDRWGNVVFEDYHFLPNEPQHGWDGRFKEKIMNPAVFTYLAELKDIEDKPIVKPGEVTLLR